VASGAMSKKKTISRYITKWVFRLGLRAWDVRTHMCYENKHNRKVFITKDKNHERSVTSVRIASDWRYMEINLYIYWPAFKNKSNEDIESTVLHELCHSLVNEMRTTGIDHEERVVT
jgi:hypothetical protein